MPSLGAAQVCSSEKNCLTLYAAAIIDRKKEPDFALAGQALRAGCIVSKTGKSCRILSFLISRKIVLGGVAERRIFNQRACQLGDRIGCNFLAAAMSAVETYPISRTAHDQAAWRLVEDSCVSGNDYACRELVHRVSEQDADRYSENCNLGDQLYCGLLGGYFIYPFQGDAKQLRAEDLFRSSCNAEQGIGCVFLAEFLSSGLGSDFFEKSFDFYVKACQLGVAYGCNAAQSDLLVRKPAAILRDQMVYLRPSCDAGSSRACLLTAKYDKNNSEEAIVRYALLLRNDCLEGGGYSCREASKVYDTLIFQLPVDLEEPLKDQRLQNYIRFAQALDPN